MIIYVRLEKINCIRKANMVEYTQIYTANYFYPVLRAHKDQKYHVAITNSDIFIPNLNNLQERI